MSWRKGYRICTRCNMKGRDEMKLFILPLIILALVPFTASADFCDGDYLMQNISVDGTIISVSSTLCTQGCLDEALLTFGEPGCQENEVIKWIMIAGIAIFMTIFIRAVFKD